MNEKKVKKTGENPKLLKTVENLSNLSDNQKKRKYIYMNKY